jgi:acyl carrier protein
MIVEDRFHLLVANAIRGCSLPSVDSITSKADDALLITYGFEELGFDSLAFMEFCIAVHVETGIEMDVAQVQSLETPLGVAEFLRHRR